MVEQWKDVVGYEDHYMISNLGNVWQIKRKLLMKQKDDRDGYKLVNLTKNNKGVQFRVHRLVGQAFIDNPENKPMINHIDGIKYNNIVNNLEWVTASENGKHAFAMGLAKNAQGTEQVCSKFTEEQIKFIRESYVNSCTEYGMRALARKFNVGPETIHRIIKRRTYKNI